MSVSTETWDFAAPLPIHLHCCDSSENSTNGENPLGSAIMPSGKPRFQRWANAAKCVRHDKKNPNTRSRILLHLLVLLTFCLAGEKLQGLEDQVRPAGDSGEPRVESAGWTRLPRLHFVLQLREQNVKPFDPEPAETSAQGREGFIPSTSSTGFPLSRCFPANWKSRWLFLRWRLGCSESPPRFCKRVRKFD